MKFTGICIITENVPALRKFYEDVLLVSGQGDDLLAEISIEGAGLFIFAKDGMERMSPGSMANYKSGIIIEIEVADVDAEYERLDNYGITFIKLPETHPWGRRSAWFKDPDGNIVNFYTNCHM